MRGRKPRLISIAPADRPVLEQVARSNSLPWYQVRRARIVLANSRGVHNCTVAFQMQCDEATVWRTCRRYEREGLAGLTAPPIRSGRPDRISPPPADADRPTGLPGADRRRVAHHPLDQGGSGSAGRHRRHRIGHQRPGNPSDLARRRSATPPDPLLEDGPAGPAVQGAGREGPLVLRQRRSAGPAGLLGGLRRRDAQQTGAGASPDPPGNPRLDRTARVRVHPARHGQHPDVPGGPQRADACGMRRDQGRGSLHRKVEGVPSEPLLSAGRVPDPGRRPRSHRRGDPRLLPV